MLLASHFHAEITAHAASAVVLIGAGLAGVLVARRFGWRRSWPLVLLAIVVTSFGGYRVAEAGALSHNHLCHAHNSDSCGTDHDKEDHTHWFGGRAARLE